MNLKRLFLMIGSSFILVSCSNFSGSNIDTSKTNLVIDDYEKSNKVRDDILSTENEDISSILEKNKQAYENKKSKIEKIDVEQWRKRLVDIGQFDEEFVKTIAKQRIKDLVKESYDLADKTGYWDVKDFVFQQLAKDFPEKSQKFPLNSIEVIYDWEISDDDENTDKYQAERGYLVENGLDKNIVYSLSNKDLKQSFRKAYEENEDAYYDDYIKAVIKMYKIEDELQRD